MEKSHIKVFHDFRHITNSEYQKRTQLELLMLVYLIDEPKT